MKRLLTWILTLSLLLSVAALGATPTGPSAGSSVAASAPPQNSTSSEQPKSERPQPSTRQQRSYQRETRNHSRISKKEWLFLGAVAGTSMSIGAIAAGGKGLAIGTLVGGWAAYGAHRVWRWLK
jgi:hypothetical protein